MGCPTPTASVLLLSRLPRLLLLGFVSASGSEQCLGFNVQMRHLVHAPGSHQDLTAQIGIMGLVHGRMEPTTDYGILYSKPICV